MLLIFVVHTLRSVRAEHPLLVRKLLLQPLRRLRSKSHSTQDVLSLFVETEHVPRVALEEPTSIFFVGTYFGLKIYTTQEHQIEMLDERLKKERNSLALIEKPSTAVEYKLGVLDAILYQHEASSINDHIVIKERNSNVL